MTLRPSLLLCGLLAAASAAPLEPEVNLKIVTSPDLSVGSRVTAWLSQGAARRGNPEEQGSYYQGDIMLTEADLALVRDSRFGLSDPNSRWPGGVVPYTITSAIPGAEQAVIRDAMAKIEAATCVSFRPRVGSDVDYVDILGDPTGCWSYVGRIGGAQVLNLQIAGCLYSTRTPVHEMMHALGIFHEHTRTDRDNHIRIEYQNIEAGMEHNFNIPTQGTSLFGTAYDYGSIMHYFDTAFSSNGQPTMVTIPVPGVPIGQNPEMSSNDITRINAMYGC